MTSMHPSTPRPFRRSRAIPRLGLCYLLALALALVLGLSAAKAADDYVLGPDSQAQPNVPQGRIEAFTLTNSTVFPGTSRAGWVYIPAQYDPAKPAALMVFQDGHAYVSTNGQVRVPTVFDNLIHRGEMPVTVGIFINPGDRTEEGKTKKDNWSASNRSFEYDSLGDAYARFVLDELIPHVTNTFKLALSADPGMRAICGMSSGGICAFTVAWERPDQFGKVLSQIGSFVNIRGGHVYPALIRKTERKPIRVFLQDGSNDLNNLHGNWPLANQEMASALSFAGYDCRFVLGDGAHNAKHGGAILPDSLRWLWRAPVQPPAPQTRDNLRGDEAMVKILPGGGQPTDWELIGEHYAFTDAACGDAEGNVYFSDLPKGILHRVDPSGKDSVWIENGPRISGLKFGPDGNLYAASQGGPGDQPKKILMIDPKTREIQEVASQVDPNDLVVSAAGWIYYTDTGAGQVIRVPISARKMSRPPTAAGGINKPNGIGLSPDQRQLFVSEYGGTNVWSFVVAEDGSLRGGERLMDLRTPVGKTDSGGDGMSVDAEGRAFVTSNVGIQVFDTSGRLGGVIARPQDKGTVSAAFGGPARAFLYVCSSDKVYRRKVVVPGAWYFGGATGGR